MPYMRHYSLLVASMYLLSKDKITAGDLEAASSFLTEFCQQFEDLYGRILHTVF